MTANDSTPAPVHNSTREAWLHAAIAEFAGMFEQVGFPLPERVHVSVGFPYGISRENHTILGQTVAREASADGVNHVFISPEAGDTAEVLRILLHELIHVALNNADGHKGRFAEAATRIGFEGSMQTTPCGMALAMELVTMAANLGDYPHGAIDMDMIRRKRVPSRQHVGTDGEPVADEEEVRVQSGPAAQTNRWVSVTCPTHVAPVRMSRSRLAAGAPLCGHDDEHGEPCGQRMIPKTA